MAKKMMYRRRRRVLPAHECKFFKRENGQEQCFFGAQQKEPFFQNEHNLQRKCAHCEEEEKNARHKEDKKEEHEVHRMEDKKEENVHRKEDKKDDKEVHRVEDKKDDKDVHRKAEAAATTAATASASSYISGLNGKGSAMPASSKNFFQSKMNADFSDVKIHTGSEASQSAKAINAKAYTVGNNIVFADNQFNTETHEGKKLLAHELTHVMQQAGGVNRKAAIPNSLLPQNELEIGLQVTGTGSSKANKRNYGQSVNIQGHTDANYDHGHYSTENMTTTRATTCGDCGTAACVHATGTMVSVFHASPTVTLPTVPGGLTPCQQERVRTFISSVLSPHEQQHVVAFNTYNGVVRTAFDYTGCQTPQALANHLQPIHDGIESSRTSAANSLSDALDPFNGTIDINCTEPQPKKDAGKQ